MKKATQIPWLLLIIGAGFLALTGWSVYRANQGTSAVTDRDYYSHGLRYNETLLEAKAAASLGWTARVKLEERRLTVLLSDKQGQPVRSASGALTLLNSPAFQDRPLPVSEQGHGLYEIQLPTGLQGEFSADLSFERDGARLSKRLLLALD